MSTIERHFNKSVVILRLSLTSGYKRTFISTGTIDAHIQRLDEKAGIESWGVQGATHRAWVGIDYVIKEGDKIRDPQGNEYIVLTVLDDGRDFAINEHKELILKIYLPPVIPTT